MQGRDAQNNINKQRLTEEGLNKIDLALKQVAQNNDMNPSGYLDTLLVASNTFIHIPSFFNRYEKGKQLLNEILEHREFNNMAAGFKAAAYIAAALVARGDTDENKYRHYLTLTVESEPQGRNGRLAKAMLEGKM